MRFDVLTLFPRLFDSFLEEGLLKKAVDHGLIDIRRHDIREWSRNKHHKVDDRPFGGGPGMLLQVGPVVECVESVQGMAEPAGDVILLTPQGRRLNQEVAVELSRRQRLLLVCGRYEGFDQRVLDILRPDELSIGDFVLNGGEVAAMVVIEAVARLLPGVLGDAESHSQDSFSSHHPWLEGPQYTRPREYRGHQVPEVLLGGDHQQIANWRRQESYRKTAERRADLVAEHQPLANPPAPRPPTGRVEP